MISAWNETKGIRWKLKVNGMVYYVNISPQNCILFSKLSKLWKYICCISWGMPDKNVWIKYTIKKKAIKQRVSKFKVLSNTSTLE